MPLINMLVHGQSSAGSGPGPAHTVAGAVHGLNQLSGQLGLAAVQACSTWLRGLLLCTCAKFLSLELGEDGWNLNLEGLASDELPLMIIV